jgi:hypothetical protein
VPETAPMEVKKAFYLFFEIIPITHLDLQILVLTQKLLKPPLS